MRRGSRRGEKSIFNQRRVLGISLAKSLPVHDRLCKSDLSKVMTFITVVMTLFIDNSSTLYWIPMDGRIKVIFLLDIHWPVLPFFSVTMGVEYSSPNVAEYSCRIAFLCFEPCTVISSSGTKGRVLLLNDPTASSILERCAVPTTLLEQATVSELAGDFDF